MSLCPMNLSLSLRGKHGVGRIDIVENRFIGMKSRGKTAKCVLVFLSLLVYSSFWYHLMYFDRVVHLFKQ